MSNNVAGSGTVAVRPMQRADVDAFAGWGRHDDPLFLHYNVPRLEPGEADDLWRYLAGAPDVRRPYAGLEDGRVVASLIVRKVDPAEASGELGIILDPAQIGRGLGRRILEAFVTVLFADGFRRLHLEVSGYNGRAIAAYRAAGFAPIDEYWADAEVGIDIGTLLDGPVAEAVAPYVRLERDGRYQTRTVRMERRLDTFDERRISHT